MDTKEQKEIPASEYIDELDKLLSEDDEPCCCEGNCGCGNKKEEN